MTVRSERARVLVTVKAAPEPSAKYGDTVCVAGIRIDEGRAEWVRLYPFPFRWMRKDQRFRKYDIIDVDVHRGGSDDRPESFRPDIDSLKISDHLDSWKQRHEVMRRVPATTTCELRAAAVGDLNAPSLGMVPVRDVHRLRIAPFKGWSPAQRQRIAAAENLSPMDLFGEGADTPPELQAPRFTVHYEYWCTTPGCPKHAGQILDWELGELQRRHLKDLPEEDAKHEIEVKFLQQKFGPNRDTSFFMGNFGDVLKRGSFSVLGVYAPQLGDVAPTLF